MRKVTINFEFIVPSDWAYSDVKQLVEKFVNFIKMAGGKNVSTKTIFD